MIKFCFQIFLMRKAGNWLFIERFGILGERLESGQSSWHWISKLVNNVFVTKRQTHFACLAFLAAFQEPSNLDEACMSVQTNLEWLILCP